MSRKAALEADELRTMINSFRCSDLVSLLGSVGRNRSGRKQELQARALQILKDPDPDINVDGFKRKIKELYKAAQDEAKQTHNLELQQQQMMAHNMSGGRMQHVLHANAMQQQRPMNNINPFVAIPSQTYHHQAQRGNLPGSNAAVYQNMPGNAYPAANMYGQPNAAMQMAQNQQLCNFGSAPCVITPSYLTTANNVKFRKLPFYNVKHEVLKPTIIVGNSHSTLPTTMRTSATQEFHFSFVLTCDMASDLAMNRDTSNGKNEYNVQAQLRITAFDNSATNNIAEYDDYLPLGLVVRLNQRQCTLPMCSPNTRSGTESRRIPRPINITPQMRMSPMNANHLVINWAVETGKTFVVSLNLVEKLSSQYLLNKLKERPTISVEVTKATIRQQYKRVIDDDDDNDEANADDDDIATTIVRVSLVCPLAKFRMMYPAKGKNCSHLQCFDGSAYISLNEKKPMWMCPVCNRALYFDDLLIDQYFLDVLQNEQLSADCQEVQLLVDGTWKSYDEENDDKQKSGNSATSPQAPSPSTSKQEASTSDSVEMIANDEDTDRKEITPADMHLDMNTAAGGPVVDLTEEEEEPQENAMEVATENVEAPTDAEISKTASPPTIPPANNHQINDDQATETSSSVEKTNSEDTNSTSSAIPTTSTAVPTDAPSSTTVSSSGYISPNIISLDDSPSPSPPRVPASPQNAIAQLNIEDS